MTVRSSWENAGRSGVAGKSTWFYAQQDLFLQVKMEDLETAALAWDTAAFADPFAEQELPVFPIWCCHFFLFVGIYKAIISHTLELEGKPELTDWGI
jgi:hypothetical protein